MDNVRCSDCRWLRQKGPHTGCYPGGRWIKWIPKHEVDWKRACDDFGTILTEAIGDPMHALLAMQQLLMNKAPSKLTPEASARAIAGLGLIEETLEYLSSTGWKPWRPVPLPREMQLEELTDILFYYLELILLSGMDWSEIVEEYKRKHQENLQRYEKAKAGDYSWDKREEKREL